MKRGRDDYNSNNSRGYNNHSNNSGGGGGGGGFGGGQRTETKLNHPFKANFNDHFETNVTSLRDVFPFIDELRQLTRPSCPEAFTLYDPYYCTGRVKEAWAAPEFGITRVIHENRDFYEDIKNGIAPPLVVRDEVENFIKDIGSAPAPYDVCVTNPPYSENHIERFMKRFAIPSRKPWAMLVPDYIPTKPWFISLVEEHYTAAPVIGRNVGFDAKGPKTTAAGLAMGATIPRMIPLMPIMEDPTPEPAPVPEPTPAPAPAAEDAPAATATTAGETEAKAEAEAGDAPKPEGADADEQAAPKGITFSEEDASKEKEKEKVEKFCQEPFYIVPRGRYEFDHPVHAGRDRSHFKSLWIISGGRRTTELLKSLKAKADVSKVSVASGRTELQRQTAAPGTAGSAALIPNPPRKNFQNQNFQQKQPWRKY